MSTTTFTLNQISEEKTLPLNSNTECNVSPLVIMSILNHYQRRPSNKRISSNQQPRNLYPPFVIGLLFGHKDTSDTNQLIINDTFGLETQINPQNNQVALELSIAKEALKLHSLSHPSDRLIGWYKTGLIIEASSTSIHDVIILKELSKLSNKLSHKKVSGLELDDSEYIHLLIDTKLTNNKLTIKCYNTISIIDPIQQEQYNDYLKEKKRRDRLNKINQKNKNKMNKNKKGKNKNKNQNQNNINDEKENNNLKKKKENKLIEIEKPFPIFYRFKEIKCNYLASQAVKIGLEMIIDSPPEGNNLDSPSLLMNDTTHIESILQNLLQNLENIQQYIENIIKGGNINCDNNQNKAIGWLIGDALSSVPNLSPVKFEQIISNKLQDYLMMVYLGKMTKAQLVIADKINKVLPTTVPGFQFEQSEL